MQILHIDRNVNVKFNMCKTKARTKPHPGFVGNTDPVFNSCHKCLLRASQMVRKHTL